MNIGKAIAFASFVVSGVFINYGVRHIQNSRNIEADEKIKERSRSLAKSDFIQAAALIVSDTALTIEQYTG